jgi:hypothetical protein
MFQFLEVGREETCFVLECLGLTLLILGLEIFYSLISGLHSTGYDWDVVWLLPTTG